MRARFSSKHFFIWPREGGGGGVEAAASALGVWQFNGSSPATSTCRLGTAPPFRPRYYAVLPCTGASGAPFRSRARDRQSSYTPQPCCVRAHSNVVWRSLGHQSSTRAQTRGACSPASPGKDTAIFSEICGIILTTLSSRHPTRPAAAMLGHECNICAALAIRRVCSAPHRRGSPSRTNTLRLGGARRDPRCESVGGARVPALSGTAAGAERAQIRPPWVKEGGSDPAKRCFRGPHELAFIHPQKDLFTRSLPQEAGGGWGFPCVWASLFRVLNSPSFEKEPQHTPCLTSPPHDLISALSSSVPQTRHTNTREKGRAPPPFLGATPATGSAAAFAVRPSPHRPAVELPRHPLFHHGGVASPGTSPSVGGREVPLHGHAPILASVDPQLEGVSRRAQEHRVAVAKRPREVAGRHGSRRRALRRLVQPEGRAACGADEAGRGGGEAARVVGELVLVQHEPARLPPRDGALAALLQRAALDGAKQPTQLLPAPRRARHRRRAAAGRGLRTRHGRVAGVSRVCLEPPGRAGSLARPHGGREAGSRRGRRARRRRAA